MDTVIKFAPHDTLTRVKNGEEVSAVGFYKNSSVGTPVVVTTVWESSGRIVCDSNSNFEEIHFLYFIKKHKDSDILVDGVSGLNYMPESEAKKWL